MKKSVCDRKLDGEIFFIAEFTVDIRKKTSKIIKNHHFLTFFGQKLPVRGVGWKINFFLQVLRKILNFSEKELGRKSILSLSSECFSFFLVNKVFISQLAVRTRKEVPQKKTEGTTRRSVSSYPRKKNFMWKTNLFLVARGCTDARGWGGGGG